MTCFSFAQLDCVIILTGTAGGRADLVVGDELIEVNGVSLATATHEEIITSIHKVRSQRLPKQNTFFATNIKKILLVQKKH